MRKIACIIPARLHSVRFPRKILADLAGKPLIQHVWEAAASVSLFSEVVFAIDAVETAQVIESFGGRYYFTSESCRSGTMRLVELAVSHKVEADIFVNWQGDEPFISSGMIEALLSSSHEGGIDVWTLKKRITNREEITSPHIAKVVTDREDRALYFSRSTIPFYRDLLQDEGIYYKHIGIYAFTYSALMQLHRLPSSHLEEGEQLEQLSFLFHGLKIRVHESLHEGGGD